jgi:anti-anti-sigma factor
VAFGGLCVERRVTPLGPLLVLSGELDLDVVGAFDAVLAAEIGSIDGDVCIDLAELEFIGYVGVDLLVALSHRLAATGRRLRIVAISPIVEQVLTIVGVELRRADSGERFVPTRWTSRVPGGCGRPPGARSPRDHDVAGGARGVT